MRIQLSALVATSILAAAPAAHAIVGSDPDIEISAEADTVCWIHAPQPNDTTAGEPGTTRPDEYCNCVLIGPDVVLTNSTCVEHIVEDDESYVDQLEVRFGGTASPAIGADDIALYRYYGSAVDGLAGDLVSEFAAIHLTSEPGITPAIVNTAPLGTSFEGTTVELFGYGPHTASPTFPGELQGVKVDATLVTYTRFNAGEMDKTTCEGDAGAPLFAMVEGEMRLVAISGRPFKGDCTPTLSRLRVDAVADAFILPYLGRYQTGTCGLDDTCTDDADNACAYPDPDCECGFDGTCDDTCGVRDLDCPLGALPGEACTADEDCEFDGRCVAAEDDPSFTYCDVRCAADESTGPGLCPNEMQCGGDRCAYGTPSRGSQGFACQINDECRSSICEGGICVFECAAPEDCNGDTQCLPSKVAPGMNVCKLPDDSGSGGFCSASPADPDGGSRLGLLALGLLLGVAAIGRRRAR